LIVPAPNLVGAFPPLAVHLGACGGKLEFNDNDLLLELDDDATPAFEGMHFGIGNDADATQRHQEKSPEEALVDLVFESS
jgi:hypothetical protein